MNEKNHRKLWAIVFMFGLFLVSFIGEAFAKHEHVVHTPSQSIYIDAGSSGARLGIYSVETKEDGSLDIKEVANQSTKGGVGIHTLAHNTSEVGSYLEPLIQYAENFLGKDHFKEVPIYVYGTGGLRSISTEDQNKVIHAIESYLKTQKHFKKVRAKVVKGQEEGAFGWLTVNYLSGNFNGPDAHTVGVVDVGGATLQLAFEIGKPEADEEHILSYKIGGKSHTVYIYSYPVFGQNVLLRERSNLQKACLEKSYTHDELAHRYDQCDKELSSIFKETCTNLAKCGLTNISQPELHGKFMGIGGMVYLTREFGVESLSLRFLQDKGREVCSMTDAQAQDHFRNGFVDDPSALCFRVVYLKSMLFGEGKQGYNGLGFSKEEEIQVPREINGHKSFSWTIGAVYFNTVIKNFARKEKSGL